MRVGRFTLPVAALLALAACAGSEVQQVPEPPDSGGGTPIPSGAEQDPNDPGLAAGGAEGDPNDPGVAGGTDAEGDTNDPGTAGGGNGTGGGTDE